jgi:hypothetical protein
MLREPGPLHLAIEVGASVTCAACGRIVDLELSCELLKSRRDGLRVTRCHYCLTKHRHGGRARSDLGRAAGPGPHRRKIDHSVASELVDAFGADGALRILSARAIGGQR